MRILRLSSLIVVDSLPERREIISKRFNQIEAVASTVSFEHLGMNEW